MAEDLNYSFFTPYGKYFSSVHPQKSSALAFKNHAQFPILVDILSRKNNHHAVLYTEFSSRMYHSFLEALLQHVNHDIIPYHLRRAELIHLHTENFIFTAVEQKILEKDFQSLRERLDVADRYLIFVLTDTKLLAQDKHLGYDDFLRKQIDTLLFHPKCRFLILTSTKEKYPHHDHFTFLHISGPTKVDTLTILKQQRKEFENFHRVGIADELLNHAYSLAERYLSTSDTLEKTLLLLDSAAARASASVPLDQHNQAKPVLTFNILSEVLSDWTQIPASHIHLNKFKLNEFMHGMQQRIFGQDAALTIIGHELQSAQAHLQQKSGPLCRFLFAGPEHTGKKSTALALVDQLFKQLNVLYFAQPATAMLHSIADINLQRCIDNHYYSLKDVIRETPYAVIMFENIEDASPAILDGLHEMLTTGCIHDSDGNEYNCCQTIIILSTSLGTQNLTAIAKSLSQDEDAQGNDLMHLVMHNEQQQVFAAARQYSPLELAEEITPEITAALPSSLCEHLQIVPFLPLERASIEQIIHLKLKMLVKQLDMRHSIELGYAPEIIRYLANEVLIKQEIDKQTVDIDKALNQLYSCIEQAILSHADNQQRPNQLFLQLNETGQSLQCDWLMTLARHHAT